MCGESPGNHRAIEEGSGTVVPPIEDLFSFDEDQVDFMSAQSFPASDPPPAQSAAVPPEPSRDRDERADDESDGNGA